MNLIKKKYDFIDSFRGIAILLVLLTHVDYVFQPQNKFAHALYGTISIGSRVLHLQSIRNFVIAFGAYGVQLFYLVSAFTLFNSFYIRQSRGEISVFNFYLRRFFRIAPLFYLCMTLLLLNTNYHFFENYQFFTPRILYEIKNKTIEDINYWYLTTFTFTNGFFPKYIDSPYPGGWSIAVEFSFYMILPFLFRFIKNLNVSLLLSFISILATTLIFRSNFHGLFNSYIRTSLLNHFSFFSLGISAFFFFKNEKKYSYFNCIQFLFITIIAIYALFSKNILPFTGLCFFLLVISSSNRNNIINNRPYNI